MDLDRSRRQSRDERVGLRAHAEPRASIPLEMQRAMVRRGSARAQERRRLLRLFATASRSGSTCASRRSPDEANDEEFVAIVGFGGLADELAELLDAALCARAAHRERRTAR